MSLEKHKHAGRDTSYGIGRRGDYNSMGLWRGIRTRHATDQERYFLRAKFAAPLACHAEAYGEGGRGAGTVAFSRRRDAAGKKV
jgi:hypothetical protein